jgi:16S rRNA (guanine966-N2)-methyltransferase
MRVVSGKFGGRALTAPASRNVRPTSDRTRETIFNILAHTYDDTADGARVIDLFAGSGALGLEALSRGARFALFVDDSPEGRALVRANVEALGLGGVTKIFRRDATRLGPMSPQEPFTLAFLDPPYGRDLTGKALASLRDGAWLAPGALCVVEENADATIEALDGFTKLDARRYGATQIVFLRFGE